MPVPGTTVLSRTLQYFNALEHLAQQLSAKNGLSGYLITIYRYDSSSQYYRVQTYVLSNPAWLAKAIDDLIANHGDLVPCDLGIELKDGKRFLLSLP